MKVVSLYFLTYLVCYKTFQNVKEKNAKTAHPSVKFQLNAINLYQSIISLCHIDYQYQKLKMFFCICKKSGENVIASHKIIVK